MIQLLTLTIIGFMPGVTPEKPDTNFKSIHQVQSEEMKNDTVRPDTVKITNPARGDSLPAIVPRVKALSSTTLLLVIIILLLILIVILILIRSRQKKEPE